MIWEEGSRGLMGHRGHRGIGAQEGGGVSRNEVFPPNGLF